MKKVWYINLESLLGKSDHSVITFTFNSYITSKATQKTRYIYDKGDYVNMKKKINIDWNEWLADNDIISQWSTFRSKLEEAGELFIPKVTIKTLNLKRDITFPLVRKFCQR